MKFKEVMVFDHDVFHDDRGDIWTLWKEDEYPSIDLKFNHDKISTSKKNVLRGIHGDTKSWKMMECIYGELLFVVVDNRPESKTYLDWDVIILSDKNRRAVLVPPNFGNGFLVRSDFSMFHYKWSYDGEYVDADEQFTLKWNDPKININWGIDNPILSKRDE